MQYGPVADPTPSTLAYDAHGIGCVNWECGLPEAKTLTKCPAFEFRVSLAGGGIARASFPAAKQTVLVDDTYREVVTLHWALVTKPARLKVGRKVVMGCHAFVEERSDGFVGLTIIPNTGTLDPKDTNTWPGAVRFTDMRVELPPRWKQVGAGFGAPGDWYFGPRCWTSRRMALVPPESPEGFQAAQRWLALGDLQVDGHHSLGPARYRIPQRLQARWQHLQGSTGAGPLLTDRATSNGYMQGGVGIIPLGGFEGSAGAARSYAIDVPRVLAGHPCAAFHAATGEPIQPDEWQFVAGYPLTDSYLRFDYWNRRPGSLVDTFGWTWSQGGPKEFNPGPSASRGAILAIQKHDAAHLIRALHVLTAAWWYCRDWAAWLALRMIAVDILTSRFLLGANQYLREGWARKALATAIAITKPGLERDTLLRARENALRRLSDTCFGNGFARAGAYPNSDNGEPWSPGFDMPTEYATAAAWQLALYADALFDLLCCGPQPALISASRASWLLTEGARQLYDNPSLPLRSGSPPTHVGVVRAGALESPISRGTTDLADSNHSIHSWHHLALCWLYTGEPRWKMLMEKVGPCLELWKLPAYWASTANAQPEWTCVAQAYI